MRSAILIFFSCLFTIQSFSQSNSFEKLDGYLKETTRSDKWYEAAIAELQIVQHVDLNKTVSYIDKILKSSNLELDNSYRFELYLLKAEILSDNSNYEASFKIMRQLKLDLEDKLEDKKYARYWITLGYCYHDIGKNDSLKICLKKIQDKVQAPDPAYYNYLVLLSILQQKEGQISDAIKNSQAAAKYFEKANLRTNLAGTYNMLAENYKNLKNYKEALVYYNLTIALFKKANNQLELGRNYSNIGSVYSSLNKLDDALLYYDSGYKVAVQINNPLSIAQNLTNKGNVYEKLGKYDQSKAAFEQCLQISNQFGIEYGKLLSLTNLGNTSRLLKDFTKGQDYLNAALELALKLKATNIEVVIYKQQAKLYEDLGDYRKAYSLINKFHTLDDSLHSEKVEQESLALKEKYDTEKKSNEINELKSKAVKSQTMILVLALLALTLIIIIQWSRSKRKQTRSKLVDEEKERKYLKKIVETRENEMTAQITQIAILEEDIKTMHEELVTIIDNSSEGAEKLKHQLKSQLIDKNEFVKINEGFEERITDFNQDYFKLLLSKYPELTLSELKLCAYLRLGLSTKEIAQVLNRSVRTIESSRTDIRKKMKLTNEDNLTSHLIVMSN